MLTAGIIGSEGKLQTAGLISSILASSGKKVSTVDTRNLQGYDFKRVRDYIGELEKNKVEILLLKISIADIDILLFNDIQFDILIYTDKADDITEDDRVFHSDKMRSFFSHMAEKGVAIVNVDDSELISLLQGMKHHIVTYGFNTKASITTSSIGDAVSKDSLICCLQRRISTTDGNIIEPQEYKLKFESPDVDSHDLLAAASFAIVNGIDLNRVGEIQPF